MKMYFIKVNILLVLFLISCMSFPGKRSLSYVYRNPNTCGFFQFYRDGSFRYLLGGQSQDKCEDKQSIPEAHLGDIAKYSFDSKTGLSPYLLLAKSQEGSYEIRFSESLNALYMKRKGYTEEEKFDRMK